MPPAPMTMIGRTCFGRGCRAVWTAARIRASRPSVAGGFGIGRSPSELFLKVARAQRRDLALTMLFVSRRFEGPFDDRRCLAAHDGGAILIEVDSALIEVEMPDHEAVLVVNKNLLLFDEGVSDGIPGVDAGIGGAAGYLSLDWSDGGPYELAATGK